MYAKKNIPLGIMEGINPDHSITGQTQLRLQTWEELQVAQEEGTGQEDLEPEESHHSIQDRSTLCDLTRTPWIQNKNWQPWKQTSHIVWGMQQTILK